VQLQQFQTLHPQPREGPLDLLAQHLGASVELPPARRPGLRDADLRGDEQAVSASP
jgi:hypothetical protein